MFEIAFAILAFIIAAIHTLFLLYVFAMNVQRVYEAKRMAAIHWLTCGFYIVIAILLDVVMNYTVFAAMTLDFPKKGEWTFSKRLERLKHNTDWRGKVARAIEYVIDPFAPDFDHIK